MISRGVFQKKSTCQTNDQVIANPVRSIQTLTLNTENITPPSSPRRG